MSQAQAHSSNHPGGEAALAQESLTKQLPAVLSMVFHTAQLSNQSGDYPGQAQLFSLLWVSPGTPISLVMS